MMLKELGNSAEDSPPRREPILPRKISESEVASAARNFLMAETGSVCIVESEGNGPHVLSLPQVLITIAGIEKVIPTFRDLEVFLQLLARSATGERMNPYNSIWTGVTPVTALRNFTFVLLDNGRTGVLADAESRETLDCILAVPA